MKCSNCGFEFNEGMFCPECGTKIEEVKKDTSKPNDAEPMQEQESETVSKNIEVDETKHGKIESDDTNCDAQKDIDAPKEEMKSGDTDQTANSTNDQDASKSDSNRENTKSNSQSTFGVISFILGILSVCCIGVLIVPEIAGIILGAKGKKDSEHKTGLAKAGFVINIAALVIWIFVFAVVGSSSDSSSKTDAGYEQVEEESKDTEAHGDAQEGIEKIKGADEIESEESIEQDTILEYSYDDICNMCSEYYAETYSKELPYALVDHVEGNLVFVELWENVNDASEGTNSIAYYSVDKNTLIGYEGYDEVTAVEIDLSDIAASYNSNSRKEAVDKKKEVYSDLFKEIKIWQPLDEYDKHVLMAVGNGYYKDNFYISISNGNEDTMEVFFGDINITDNMVNLVTDTGNVYYVSRGKYGIIGGHEGSPYPSYAGTFEVENGYIKNVTFLQSDVDLSKLEGTYSLQDEDYSTDLCYKNVLIKNSTNKEIFVSRQNNKDDKGIGLKKNAGIWTVASGLPGKYSFYIYDKNGKKIIETVTVDIDEDEIYGSEGYQIVKTLFGYKAKKYTDSEIEKIREEEYVDYGEAALIGSTLVPLHPRKETADSEYLDVYKTSYMNLLTGAGNYVKENELRKTFESEIGYADYEFAFKMDKVKDDSLKMHLYFDNVLVEGIELIPGKTIIVTDSVIEGKHKMYWESDKGEKSNEITVDLGEGYVNKCGYSVQEAKKGDFVFGIDSKLEMEVRNGSLKIDDSKDADTSTDIDTEYNVVVDASDGYVNIRNDASKDGDILFEESNGAVLFIDYELGDWLEVPLHPTGTDPIGWVHKSQVYILDKEPNNGYVIEGSDSGYFTEGIVEGLSAFECRLARNEIYARHGKIFKDEALQIYFNNCTWYKPQSDDVPDSMLNEWELANIDLIVNYEKSMGYR